MSDPHSPIPFDQEPQLDLVAILSKAFATALSTAKLPPAETGITELTSVGEIAALANQSSLPIDRLLSQAALASYSAKHGPGKRAARDGLSFYEADKRSATALAFAKDSNAPWSLTTKTILAVLQNANKTIELIDDLATGNETPIFTLLGLRNLSSFIGEIFASELYKLEKNRLMPNPNQDGYPDLLALTKEGRKYVEDRAAKGETSYKRFWSPYPYGGIEVKATCGNTYPASIHPKPKIGEARWPLLISAEWKAHHRDTNNLLGIYWDFIDGLPTVLAVFYCNRLGVADWGNVVQPKEGGGNTTSVSIMKKKGVKKMGGSWVILPQSSDYRSAICRKKVFDINDECMSLACSAWRS